MRSEEKKLWEVKHNYYCEKNNYFSNECIAEYGSWSEFLEEEGDNDLGLNLLFRWDWYEGDDHDLPEYNGDDYYRNGELSLFWMGQRKGLYRCSRVSVCRADEPAVREWLAGRYEYLKSLWEPF